MANRGLENDARSAAPSHSCRSVISAILNFPIDDGVSKRYIYFLSTLRILFNVFKHWKKNSDFLCHLSVVVSQDNAVT
jgi:hypothetical protein